MTEVGRRATAPMVFRIIAVLSLLWNGFGAFDYVMTNVRDRDYLAKVPPETMQAIDAYPLWVMIAWGLGVWGAVAGSLLLLGRSRFAVPAFAVSLAGLAASTVYQLWPQRSVNAPAGADAMMIAIWIAAVLQLILAIRWSRQRLLR